MGFGLVLRRTSCPLFQVEAPSASQLDAEAPVPRPEEGLADAPERKPVSKFALNVLWMDKQIGVAVDQLFSGQRSPVTPYFFWPREEAWDMMREALELESSWIAEAQAVELLNTFTALINHWQSDSPSLQQAKTLFPSAKFHA